jgi:hypothetical protein
VGNVVRNGVDGWGGLREVERWGVADLCLG